jgi:hypothetical protein
MPEQKTLTGNHQKRSTHRLVIKRATAFLTTPWMTTTAPPHPASLAHMNSGPSFWTEHQGKIILAVILIPILRIISTYIWGPRY